MYLLQVLLNQEHVVYKLQLVKVLLYTIKLNIDFVSKAMEKWNQRSQEIS